MKKFTAWVLAYPDNRDRYLLAAGLTLQDAEVVPWRDARRRFDPDAYINCCRTSFADWISRHPELTG